MSGFWATVASTYSDPSEVFDVPDRHPHLAFTHREDCLRVVLAESGNNEKIQLNNCT